MLFLGPFGASYVEMLILHERWAGERLVLEPAVSKSWRGGRPSSVSAVSVGPSIDIWRSCGFFGSMLRTSCQLPGGLGRFLSCRIGADHCRLRGLVGAVWSWSDFSKFQDDIWVLFVCPGRSGAALGA